jgi:hypothetical protein
MWSDRIQFWPPLEDQRGAVAGFVVTSGTVDVVPVMALPGLDSWRNGIDLDGGAADPSASPHTVLSSPAVPPGRYRVEVTLAGDRHGDSDTTVRLTMGSLDRSVSLASPEGPIVVSAVVTVSTLTPLVVHHTSGVADDGRKMLLLAAMITPEECAA